MSTSVNNNFTYTSLIRIKPSAVAENCKNMDKNE